MADVDFNPTLIRAAANARKAQTPINLASLPREDAIRFARMAGGAFLEDSEALREAFREIGEEWLNVNMPIADGQTDEEFSELGDALEAEFARALSAGLQKSRQPRWDVNRDPSLKRAGDELAKESAFAWKIYNTLVFMVQALPTDTADGLPVQCTLADMRCDMDKLATSLMNLADFCSRGIDYE